MLLDQPTLTFDLGELVEEVESSRKIVYKDPFGGAYSDDSRMTRTQRNALHFYRQRGKGIMQADEIQKKKVLRPAIVAMIGAKGSGKMLANSEPVLTPRGFVPNGSLRVGDEVIGRNGEATEVVGVYPQGKQDIVRVEFTDGTFVRASWDHLWSVQTGSAKSRGEGFKTLTTRQIADDLYTRQGYAKWYLPSLSPVQYAASEALPLPAYCVGALLGDGGLTRSTPILTSADAEIVDRVSREAGVSAKRISASKYDYTLSLGNRGGQPNPLTVKLRALGMMGVGAKAKRVPVAYMTASVADRIDLLRGLMDTDGAVTGVGTAEFYTSSRGMADDVVGLARSLGLVTRVQVKPPPTGTEYEESYRVRINAPFNPFWLPRKASRFNVAATQGRVKGVARIVPDGREEATCIAVAAEDSLYVTRDFNVTHNTRFGAKFAIDLAQRFPESIGCIISNSYEQATGISAPQLVDECERLGYAIEFFSEKKIRGKRMTQLYIIDLDGRGFDAGVNCYVLARSFDAVKRLEGIELDWLWAEEIQDVDWDSFRVVYTRVRGKNAWRQIYIAGMPFDDTHWMYKRLPELGCVPENDLREKLGLEPFDAKAYSDLGVPIPEHVEDLHLAESVGVMFEPVIFENEKNLPDGEIGRLAASLDPVTFERWIFGKRTSMTTDRVVYAYDDEMHRKGRASKILSVYDPSAPLILSIDFNTRPMCASVWQSKPWNDKWLAPEYLVDYEDGKPVFFRWATIEGLDPVKVRVGEDELPAPDRDVAVQVDEFELWRGDTAGMMEAFADKYGRHLGPITILGDATGNRDDTRSGTTDWRIIENAAMKMSNCVVVPGLISNSDLRSGKINYTNPPRRDTFNVLNAALKDPAGRSWLFFMPKSALRSGGVAASVMSARKRPDGYLDDSNDKKTDESLPRTHFFDTVRYFAWWFRGGLISREQFDANVQSLRHDLVLDHSEDRLGGWASRSPGTWGGF